MKKSISTVLRLFSMSFLLFCVSPILAKEKKPNTSSYNGLLTLCKDLRILERPSLPNGVPDYTGKTAAKIQLTLKSYRNRLKAMKTSDWTLEQKVDLEIIRAEMNGLDYNLRILQPWVRDPAFYAIIFSEQSDTPTHEGPTSHTAIELWAYSFPLSKESISKLTAELKIIPPLYEQAKINLTGNARDLWIAGIGNIRDQLTELDNLTTKTKQDGKELNDAIAKAKAAILDLADWLEKKASTKTGPSGIGKENYTWHLRHVLLVPLSWEEEVTLLTRELTRAYASLQLEQEHNRNLPQAKVFTSEGEYAKNADAAVTKMMWFLKDKKILPVQNYMEPELRKHLGGYQAEEKRNFFSNIMHQDPSVLYAHSSHWFEIARLQKDPHPNIIRRDPLPYNIWMTRSEGLATSMEETFMHAGLWDDNPRSKELVWIMLAQRCARGLASLYAQANEINYEKAREYQVTFTPKGWIGDVSLVGFEQHLYLRQPGYGTSYVTGKYQLEGLLMEQNRALQNKFSLYEHFEKFYATGIIPISLIKWQMSGKDDEIRSIHKNN